MMAGDPYPVDENEIATSEELLARLKRIEAGEVWPSNAEPQSASETPLTPGEIASLRAEFYKFRKRLPRPRCLAGVTPPCGNPPIDAHTIQRKGPLSLLDDGTGHVLVFEVKAELPPSFGMRPRGIRQASTFPGLCSKHDTEFFKPIDTQTLLPTDEQLFYLSYRAVLHRLYLCRQSEIEYRNHLKLVIKTRSRGIAADFLAHLTKMRWLTRRLEAIADFYTRMREAREWRGGLTHLTGRNIWMLPFAVTSYFEPVFNPDGTRIEPALGPSIGSFITLNVVPQAEGSVVSLSYPTEFKPKLDKFLASFRPPIDEMTFVERVWQTALLYCDNIVVAPRYWHAVPEHVQSAITGYALQNPLARHEPPGSAISLFAWITDMPAEHARARFEAAWR